jgi:hypothetical protein
VNNQGKNGRILRRLFFIIGGIGVVAVSFFATLFVLDYKESVPTDPNGRDLLRAEHARSIEAALEKYRSARKTYPVFPSADVLLSDLKKALVDGGYLNTIPADPLWRDKPYRYVSYNGSSYGLLFHVELAKANIPKGGQCLIEVGASATGWWGQPPTCPF